MRNFLIMFLMGILSSIVLAFLPYGAFLIALGLISGLCIFGACSAACLFLCARDTKKQAADQKPCVFDLIQHIHRQREFSKRTFGPGQRTDGVIDHIRKELEEIKASPDDLSEWADVIILALDGAWRIGYEPREIAKAILQKQQKNESRKWPDWRTAEPGKAIEHVREVQA